MGKAQTSDRLKQIMKERRMKQVDILEACKPYCDKYGIRLGKNDLSQYINGKVQPGQDKLTVLGLALDVNEVWLMGYNVPASRDALSDAILKSNEDVDSADVVIWDDCGKAYDLSKLPDGTREDLTKVVQLLPYEYSDENFGLQVILDKEDILNLDALSLDKKKDLMKYIRFLLSDEK